MKSSLPPEYLIAICEFSYAPHGGKRYLPTEVRRFLMGANGRRGLPERVARRFGKQFLVPLYFAFIKHPIKIGGVLLVNAALGAIAIYRVMVVDEDSFMQLCKAVHEEWRKRFGNVKEIKGFRMMASYGVDVRLESRQDDVW